MGIYGFGAKVCVKITCKILYVILTCKIFINRYLYSGIVRQKILYVFRYMLKLMSVSKCGLFQFINNRSYGVSRVC